MVTETTTTSTKTLTETVVSFHERTRTLVSRSTAIVLATITATVVTPIIVPEFVTWKVAVPTMITKTTWYQVETTITTAILPVARNVVPANPSTGLTGGVL